MKQSSSTRRAFFAGGGAVLGAGIAASAGATTVAPATSDASRDRAADREALRALQAAYAGAVERQAWDEAAALFAQDAALDLGDLQADGRRSILAALSQQSCADRAMHVAYRANGHRADDTFEFRADGATATFHVDVKVHVPLKDDCTAAAMARLQGLLADVRWESGCLHVQCRREAEGWRLTSLRYRARR